MISRVLSVLLCCAFASGAAASGYSEFNAGIASEKHEDADGALAHMASALAAPDLDPSFRAPAHVVRAGIYQSRKQWDAVVAESTAAIAADPQYVSAYGLRAFAYTRMGKPDLAVADITVLINAKPFLDDHYYQRGWIYLSQKNYAAAIADYNTVVIISPDEPSSYIARGTAYGDAQDFPHALSDMDKAIELSPRYYMPYYQRALIYAEQGDYARARADLNDAARLAPDNMNVTLAQGLVAWAGADASAALQYFQQVRDSKDKRLVPYGALWMAIVTLSNGGADGDAAKTLNSGLDRKLWPAPVLDLYSGLSSVDALLKAGSVGGAIDQKEHGCEANFYGGEWFVLHHNAAAGKPLVAAAAANCPQDFTEYVAAIIAYRRTP